MRALCLSGGGSKGAYQIGVLKHLLQFEELDYEILCGISVGALNAAGLLKMPTINESINWLEDLWLNKIDTNAVYKHRTVMSLLKSFWHKPVYDATPLKDLIHRHIDKEQIIASGKKLSVGAVCLDTGEFYYADGADKNIHDWILASASYPMFMEAVQIDGKLWADGQIKHVTPIRQAIKLGATEIDVVLCSNFDSTPWRSDQKSHIPDQFIRTLDLMSSEIMSTDIKFLKLKNWMVETACITDIPYKKVKARIIMPKQDLVANSLNFKHDEIKRMFDVGFDIENSIVLKL